MAHPIVAQIESLIPRFCQLRFESKDAIQALGTIADASDQRRLVLRPRLGSADRIILGQFDWPLFPGFLGDIEFSWVKPQRLEMSDLRRAFGPLRVLPAIDEPVGPDTLAFEIRHQPLQGVVLVTATPERGEQSLLAESIVLRRMAPDPFPLEIARAARIVVFGDFGAVRSLSGVTPLSSNLWKKAGLSDLIGLFSPRAEFEVENLLGYLSRTLALTFRPDRIEDFSADGIVRSIPELAVFVELRQALARLQAGRIGVDEFVQLVDWDSVPGVWRRRVEHSLAAPTPVIRDIDMALSKQCQVVFANERFREFQAAWLGLQFLAANMNFADGSRVEVYQSSESMREEMFREGLFESENFHRLGVPPIAALLGEPLGRGPEAFEHLKKLSPLAAQIDTPIAFGLILDHAAPSKLRDLAVEPHADYLIACAPRICLRPGLDAPGFGPTCFDFDSESRPNETAVWGSAAWAFGALVAAAHGRNGTTAATAASAALPPLIAERDPATEHVLESPMEITRAWPRGDNPMTVIHVDIESQKLSFASLRALRDSKVPNDKLGARLTRAPLPKIIWRIHHQSANESDAKKIEDLIRQALIGHVPGADILVEFRPTGPNSKDRVLQVQLTLPLEIEGQPLRFAYEWPWTLA